jgi:hypothetical protein
MIITLHPNRLNHQLVMEQQATQEQTVLRQSVVKIKILE